MWIDRGIILLNAKVKWRVSQKLTVLIGIILLALFITGSLSIYTLSVFNGRFEKTLDINMKRVIIASDMNDDLMRFDRLVVEFIRARYQADRNDIRRELTGINRHFNTSIGLLKGLKQDAANNEILGDLEPSWQEYCRTVAKIIAKSRRNQFEGALELWDGWASVRYRDIKYLIKQVISYNQSLAQISKVEVNHSYETVRWRIVVIIVVTFMAAVFLGVFIIRYLQVSLRNLIMVNESVSQGNLSQGLGLAIHHHAADEIGELAASNRKVVESIRKMVEDVTRLTECFLPREGAAETAGDAGYSSALIDTEKTSVLVQDLNQSLEKVKSEIELVCKPEWVHQGLQEAHERTLTTIDNFNQEIEKLNGALESLAAMPKKLDNLVLKYGSIERFSGGLKADEIIRRLLGASGEISDTMEVIKYGLLDLKMRLESRHHAPAPAESTEVSHYFQNLAKAIRNIVKRAEAMIYQTQVLQNDLDRVARDLQRAGTKNEIRLSDDNPAPPAPAFPDGGPMQWETSAAFTDNETDLPEINEFQLLLAKLERIMVNFKR